MNGKLEEQLAQLAFGDLTPDEAARIEAQVKGDPEALRALNTYHGMRSELRGLRDVPADQMSNERLRDAILAQGLKPKPVAGKSIWGWGWMPVAAGALAVAMMMVRGGGTPEPTIVLDENAKSSVVATLKEPGQDPEVERPIQEEDVFDELEPDITSAPVAAEVASASPTRPRVKSRPTAGASVRYAATTPRLTEEEKVRIESEVWSDLVASIATEGGDTVSSIDVGESTGNANPPVVIIEERVDEATGALRATEVGATNVLIGG